MFILIQKPTSKAQLRIFSKNLIVNKKIENNLVEEKTLNNESEILVQSKV
jgi:hypothetical protein